MEIGQVHAILQCSLTPDLTLLGQQLTRRIPRTRRLIVRSYGFVGLRKLVA